MNIGSQLRSGLTTIGHELATNRRLQVGIGAAVGIGGLLAFAACTSPQPPKDGATIASDQFGTYDTNRDGGVDLDEAKKSWYRDNPAETRTERLNNYYVRVHTSTFRDTWDTSIENIVRAAGGNDAVASWQEIGDFAVRTYDTANREGVKDGMLDDREKRTFLNAYGPKTENFHTERTSYTWTDVYSPRGGGYDPGPGYGNGTGNGGYDPGPGYGNTGGTGNGGYDPGPGYGNTGGSGNGGSDPGPDYGNTGGSGNGGSDPGPDYGNTGGSGNGGRDNGPVYAV